MVINKYNAINEDQTWPVHVLFQSKLLVDSKFIQGKSKFFVHVDGIYMGIFRENFQKWKFYNSAEEKYPEEGILKVCKAIVISGSVATAFDN